MSRDEIQGKIEGLHKKATDIATGKNHRYVTLAHLVLAISSYDEFTAMCENFAADQRSLINGLEDLVDDTSPRTNNNPPGVTSDYDRCFKQGVAQLVFKRAAKATLIR